MPSGTYALGQSICILRKPLPGEAVEPATRPNGRDDQRPRLTPEEREARQAARAERRRSRGHPA